MNAKDVEELSKLKSNMDPIFADALIGDLASPCSMEMESPGFSFERELETTASKSALIEELTGLPADEIKKIQSTEKKFQDYLPINERDVLAKGVTRGAYKKVENEFRMAGGNVTTAMVEALNLFREKFSAEEQNVIQKAIAALDVGNFIFMLSKGMQRA